MVRRSAPNAECTIIGLERRLAQEVLVELAGSFSNIPGHGALGRKIGASCASPCSAIPSEHRSANQWSPEPFRIDAIIWPSAQ